MIAASVGSSAWAATARRASSRSLGVVGGMNPISLPGFCSLFVTPQAKQNPAETVERERDDEHQNPPSGTPCEDQDEGEHEQDEDNSREAHFHLHRARG